MGTLAVLSGLALLVLGTSVCDAGLISKCKLRDRLNSTLPACVMNQTDMVARSEFVHFILHNQKMISSFTSLLFKFPLFYAQDFSRLIY